MAELYPKDVQTISEHLKNIYVEGELLPEATIRKFQIVRMEGEREVARHLGTFLFCHGFVGYSSKTISCFAQFRVFRVFRGWIKYW